MNFNSLECKEYDHEWLLGKEWGCFKLTASRLCIDTENKQDNLCRDNR